MILKCQKWQMHKQALQMSYMYSIWELWEMQTVEPLPGEPAESISTANVTKEYGKPGAVARCERKQTSGKRRGPPPWLPFGLPYRQTKGWSGCNFVNLYGTV